MSRTQGVRFIIKLHEWKHIKYHIQISLEFASWLAAPMADLENLHGKRNIIKLGFSGKDGFTFLTNTETTPYKETAPTV